MPYCRRDGRKRLWHLMQVLAIPLALGIGCGEMKTPLSSASDEQGIQPREAGTFVFSLGPVLGARKRAGDPFVSATTSGWLLYGREGNLELEMPLSRRSTRSYSLISAEFEATGTTASGGPTPPEEGAWVTMTGRTGLALEDISLQLSTPGLTDLPNAKLSTWIYGPLTSDVVVYHITDDGRMTRAKAEVEGKDLEWKIQIPVAGFSKYTYDDDP